jgi:signal transduction histidine kinase
MTLLKRRARNTRPVLIAGFGGLLLLMALAGLDDLRLLHSIQTRSDAVRTDFIERNRVLNRIRSDLYLSGTFVRDYVLEPDPDRADSDRGRLTRTRGSLATDIKAYSRVMSPAEASVFSDLQQELDEYWRLLEPAMQWDPDARRSAGYAFLRDQVYPRRTQLVATADQIAAINEHRLNERILQVTELFAGLRIRVALTMLIALVLGGLLAAFTTRRILAYEHAAASHLAEMEIARSELKELSTRLVAAQENERRVISRELHDEVGQSLSALLVTLGNMMAEMPEGAKSTLAGHLSSVRALAETSLRAVRDMALLLRPSMLDDLGLVPALQWQGREVSKRSNLNVSVDAEGFPDDLPDEYRTAVYRVVQEALHNCEQHAHASSVRVTLRGHANSLVLSVQDDGRGFDSSTARGMGLLGMQERIANLGGTFNVESDTHHGTLLMVRLPLPKTA